VFAVCSPDGDIDLDRNPGHGLYFDDTRYLDHDILRLDGRRLGVLLSHSFGDRSVSELANPDIQLRSAGRLSKDRISITRIRSLAGKITEAIEIRSFAKRPLEFEISLELGSNFDDIFTVRGARPGERGALRPPRGKTDELMFDYEGADGHQRSTVVTFDPPPSRIDSSVAHYSIKLKPHGSFAIKLAIALVDSARRSTRAKPSPGKKDQPFSDIVIETDNQLFNRCLERSFADLRMLVMSEQGHDFFAAGVPWYVALFGRDSLLASIETLPYQSHVAADTLRLLASHQGTRIDDARDEQPGKIPHEIRVGERARLQEPPPSPYFGTVDATPLFIVALGEYVRWTADLRLFEQLRPNVDRALDWIERWGDSDGDGLVDYHGRAHASFRNQGWKDSDNSIVDSRGRLAEPPIALIEVQGYVYRAYLEAAALLRETGDGKAAQGLEIRANDLKRRVAKAFWPRNGGYPAMAVGRGGHRANAIASNPGQALWAGVIADEDVDCIAKGLLSSSMFSGWGIRTLAADEQAYNPIDYQVGSVWPHDNALVMAGLKRHGRSREAMSVMTGIFEAAVAFPHFRLPELFAGHGKDGISVPVRYPVACNPQAWAAGALPYMFATALGLEPDALHKRLAIRDPVLPGWLSRVRVLGLRVGQATVTLDYRRSDAVTSCSVHDVKGELDVPITIHLAGHAQPEHI
jgi:glycogen debranching enzyme